MELKNGVCNLEIAIAFEKLGFEQISHWYWKEIKGISDLVPKFLRDFTINDPRQNSYKFYSAYNVAECLEIYKEKITIPKDIINVADFIAKKILSRNINYFKLIDKNICPHCFEKLKIIGHNKDCEKCNIYYRFTDDPRFGGYREVMGIFFEEEEEEQDEKR